MVRLSIQTRQTLSWLTLPLLIGLSCALMVLSRVDPPLTTRLHMALADRMAPVYGLLRRPIDSLWELADDTTGWLDVAAENRSLRAQNRELKRWVAVARALASENQALKANLHWMPDPQQHFLTARAVADVGGIYGRAVLLAGGAAQGLRKDQVAIDAEGLVGRITEIGARSARVLLITDQASRVPVTLEGSHGSAIVVGDDTEQPRLIYYSEDNHPQEGERVVTSGAANIYPAGLPVGTVHYLSARHLVVVPSARLERVDLLRIFDYGLSAINPPAAPGHVLRGSGVRPVVSGAIGRG